MGIRPNDLCIARLLAQTTLRLAMSDLSVSQTVRRAVPRLGAKIFRPNGRIARKQSRIERLYAQYLQRE